MSEEGQDPFIRDDDELALKALPIKGERLVAVQVPRRSMRPGLHDAHTTFFARPIEIDENVRAEAIQEARRRQEAVNEAQRLIAQILPR